MHGPPPEDLDSVFMLVHTYPTWEQEKREKLAKTLSSPFLDHGIRCKSYVYSELALNQDDVVACLIKEEGPNYILEVRQVTGGTLPDGKPFLGFSFELRRTSTSEMIWESEVEAEGAVFGIHAGDIITAFEPLTIAMKEAMQKRDLLK